MVRLRVLLLTGHVVEFRISRENPPSRQQLVHAMSLLEGTPPLQQRYYWRGRQLLGRGWSIPPGSYTPGVPEKLIMVPRDVELALRRGRAPHHGAVIAKGRFGEQK